MDGESDDRPACQRERLTVKVLEKSIPKDHAACQGDLSTVTMGKACPKIDPIAK